MVITKHTNVNKKSFVDEVDEFVVDELMEYELDWDDVIVREMSMEMFQILMSEYQNDGMISKFKIYSDHRNNTPELESQGIYTCTIEFQQQHCLNMTRLQYILGEGVNPEN